MAEFNQSLSLTIDPSGAQKGAAAWSQALRSILFQSRTMAGGIAASLVGINAALGITVAGVGAAAAAVAASVSKFAALERQMANVSRTTGFTNERLTEMTRRVEALSVELGKPATEVASLATEVGRFIPLDDQLGDVKKVDRITRTLAALAEVTDLVGDRAARDIIRFTNVTNASVEQVDRLGSAIDRLGDTVAAGEGEIVQAAIKMATSLQAVGLQFDTILGIGATLAELGLPVQTTGTQLQKMFVTLEKAIAEGGSKLLVFNQTLGMSTEEITKMLRENPDELFLSIFEGLKKATDGGDSLAITLARMGVTNQRTIRIFATFINNIKSLRENIATTAKEFDDLTKLSEDMNKILNTLQKQGEILGQKIDVLARAIGRDLGPAFLQTTLKAQEFVEVLSNSRVVRVFMRAIGEAGAGLANFGLDAVSASIKFGDLLADSVLFAKAAAEEFAEYEKRILTQPDAPLTPLFKSLNEDLITFTELVGMAGDGLLGITLGDGLADLFAPMDPNRQVGSDLIEQVGALEGILPERLRGLYKELKADARDFVRDFVNLGVRITPIPAFFGTEDSLLGIDPFGLGDPSNAERQKAETAKLQQFKVAESSLTNAMAKLMAQFTQLQSAGGGRISQLRKQLDLLKDNLRAIDPVKAEEFFDREDFKAFFKEVEEGFGLIRERGEEVALQRLRDQVALSGVPQSERARAQFEQSVRSLDPAGPRSLEGRNRQEAVLREGRQLFDAMAFNTGVLAVEDAMGALDAAVAQSKMPEFMRSLDQFGRDLEKTLGVPLEELLDGAGMGMDDFIRRYRNASAAVTASTLTDQLQAIQAETMLMAIRANDAERGMADLEMRMAKLGLSSSDLAEHGFSVEQFFQALSSRERVADQNAVFDSLQKINNEIVVLSEQDPKSRRTEQFLRGLQLQLDRTRDEVLAFIGLDFDQVADLLTRVETIKVGDRLGSSIASLEREIALLQTRATTADTEYANFIGTLDDLGISLNVLTEDRGLDLARFKELLDFRDQVNAVNSVTDTMTGLSDELRLLGIGNLDTRAVEKFLTDLERQFRKSRGEILKILGMTEADLSTFLTDLANARAGETVRNTLQGIDDEISALAISGKQARSVEEFLVSLERSTKRSRQEVLKLLNLDEGGVAALFSRLFSARATDSASDFIRNMKMDSLSIGLQGPLGRVADLIQELDFEDPAKDLKLLSDIGRQAGLNNVEDQINLLRMNLSGLTPELREAVEEILNLNDQSRDMTILDTLADMDDQIEVSLAPSHLQGLISLIQQLEGEFGNLPPAMRDALTDKYFKQLAADALTLDEAISQNLASSFDSLSSGIANALLGAEFDFANFAKSAVASIIQIILKMQVLIPLLQSINDGQTTGFFANLITGLGGAITPGADGTFTAPTLRTGPDQLRVGPPRDVTYTMDQGAVEMPAGILQRTPEMMATGMRGMAGANSLVNVTVNNAPAGTQAQSRQQQRQGPDGMEMDIIIDLVDAKLAERAGNGRSALGSMLSAQAQQRGLT